MRVSVFITNFMFFYHKFILIKKFLKHNNKVTWGNHKNLIVLTNKTRFSIKSILKTVIYASD
jgi:hypothetical protein